MSLPLVVARPLSFGPRRRGVGRAAGFTLVELLICLVLVGVLAALAGPPMAGLRGAQAVRGARGEVIATIEAARAAAVQRGRRARVEVHGDRMRALVDDSTASGYLVVATADLREEYGAVLTTGVPADTLLYFDARGLANPRLGRTAARYVVQAVAGSSRDSVCVSNLGLLLPPGCVP